MRSKSKKRPLTLVPTRVLGADPRHLLMAMGLYSSLHGRPLLSRTCLYRERSAMGD